MELDSGWWRTESVAHDVYTYLRAREVQVVPYYHASTQLHMRRYLVDWLAIVSQMHDLCSRTQHLAVALLDMYMECNVVSEPQLKLVALCCLILAAKFEEREVAIPSYSKLLRHITPPCADASPQHILTVELHLLSQFNWNICLPTAAHFTEYFIQIAISEGDYHLDNQILDAELAQQYIRKHVQYFLEISLQDDFFKDYLPSLVCAACIASARSCLQILPTWNDTLQKATKYTLLDMHNIIEVMLRTYKADCEQAQYSKLCTSPASPANSAGTSPVVTPATTPGTPSNSLLSPQETLYFSSAKPRSSMSRHSCDSGISMDTSGWVLSYDIEAPKPRENSKSHTPGNLVTYEDEIQV